MKIRNLAVVLLMVLGISVLAYSQLQEIEWGERSTLSRQKRVKVVKIINRFYLVYKLNNTNKNFSYL